MAQTFLHRPIELPYVVRLNGDVSFNTTQVIVATGEEVHYIGHVWLENPTGGSKTISAAGGGKIHWRSGTTTFANAGTTLDIGIQDVSAATAPAQGDGTFDVSASLVGGTDVIASDTYMETAMEAGSKTLAHGQLVAIAFKGTSVAGGDSIIISNTTNVHSVSRSNFPSVSHKVAGTFTGAAARSPLVGIEFDDGTVGWLHSSDVISAVATVAINVDTGTADEYGNFIQLPAPATLHAIGCIMAVTSASSDYEFVVYSNPLTSPSVLAAITMDSTTAGALSAGYSSAVLTTPILFEKDTPYAITVRPTTTNNVTLRTQDYGNAKFNKSNGLDGNTYAIRRVDNAGAFSDYNGGVAKTRLMQMWGEFHGWANDNGNGAGSSPTGFSNSELGL